MAKFTKQAICDSFMKLLEQKSLEQITVKDIVDDCEINRKTFYYYYRDIYALTNDVFNMRIEQVKNEMPPDDYELRDVMKVIGNYLYANKKIVFHVYKSIGYEKMNDIFYDACMGYFPEFIRESASELTIADTDMKLIASYNAITLAGVLTKWLSRGMDTFPEETIDRFFEIMHGCTRLSLENADRLNREK